MLPFRAADAATVNIDVSSSSGRVQVTKGKGPRNVRMMNNGSATAWIRAGDVGVVATTSDIPVGPGVTEVLTLEATNSVLYIAAIAAGSTGKIYFTPGTGI